MAWALLLAVDSVRTAGAARAECRRLNQELACGIPAGGTFYSHVHGPGHSARYIKQKQR